MGMYMRAPCPPCWCCLVLLIPKEGSLQLCRKFALYNLHVMALCILLNCKVAECQGRHERTGRWLIGVVMGVVGVSDASKS